MGKRVCESTPKWDAIADQVHRTDISFDLLSRAGSRPARIDTPPVLVALGDPNAFESVLTFAPDGATTRIEMRTVFPIRELRDEAVDKYHAIEGGQQTLSKLAAYVTETVRKGVED